MKILLDASFLMLMAETGENLLEKAEETLGEKIEAYVLEDTLMELKTIAGKGGRRAMSAKAALKIAERMRHISLPGSGSVDERLLEAASKFQLILATIDSQLIENARRLGIPVLRVRRNMGLSLEGYRF